MKIAKTVVRSLKSMRNNSLRTFNSQSKKFVSTFNILNLHQSGYRSAHNTLTATTKVVKDIVMALDNKLVCAAIFVDLSKAFDTVDHSLLLKCLETIGFDRKSLNWFDNYKKDFKPC